MLVFGALFVLGFTVWIVGSANTPSISLTGFMAGGIVLNVPVSGLTGFLFAALLESDPATFNSPPRLPSFAVPVLSDLPLIGDTLFNQSVIGYLVFVMVAVVWFALHRTRWSLRSRAIGEHPKAADTLGIDINRMRFLNVLLGGLVAGLGGAFYTLVSVTAFTRDLTSGAGYIALAALIFGRWNPIGALLAALLFGLSSHLQSVLSFLSTPMPSQFLAMLPYVITILAVAGLVGAWRGPAASGTAYTKDWPRARRPRRARFHVPVRRPADVTGGDPSGGRRGVPDRAENRDAAPDVEVATPSGTLREITHPAVAARAYHDHSIANLKALCQKKPATGMYL